MTASIQRVIGVALSLRGAGGDEAIFSNDPILPTLVSMHCCEGCFVALLLAMTTQAKTYFTVLGSTPHARSTDSASSAELTFLYFAPDCPFTRRSHSAHVEWRMGVLPMRLR